MNNIELEKYLIYNENYKILVFHTISFRNRHIIIPTIHKNNDIKEFNPFTESILEYIENPIYLSTTIKKFSQTEFANNGKLKKVTREVVKKYFACYHEFTLEEELEIYKKAISNGLIPEFLTINELLENNLINVSDSNKSALTHLEKKLTYKMF